jgi:putative spermidine/putrescine transport system substrate-binding protein
MRDLPSFTLSRRKALALGAAGLAGTAFGGRRALAEDFKAVGSPALQAAAKKEGALNVITLPRDWANYGLLMDNFEKLYGVKIDDANPDGSSAEELQAIRSLKSQSRAPDVVDVGPAFALTGTSEKLFQPYKVATWKEIPDDVKSADGHWYGDYFGVVSFGANMSVVKTMPRTWADLLKPEYKGMVALNGNPLGAGAAFGAVFAAALANGGSYDNIAPGIEFFGKLNAAGNYNPVKGTTASLTSGQTPILINWDYLNLAIREGSAGKTDITVVLPENAPPFGNYYCQAISAYAPHPNTAKLWMEYLYSDEGQLAFLGGFAHPIRFNSMVAQGKIPADVLKNLPSADAYKNVKFATDAQSAAAKKTLADMWPKVVKLG